MKKKKKPNKKKYILINVDIYRMSVFVTWETTGKDIARHTKKYAELDEKWVEDFDGDIGRSIGVTTPFEHDGVDYLVWLKHKPERVSTYGTLYHELHHVVEFIASDKGFNSEATASAEAKAYLFEYLINQCQRVLWK